MIQLQQWPQTEGHFTLSYPQGRLVISGSIYYYQKCKESVKWMDVKDTTEYPTVYKLGNHSKEWPNSKCQQF